jgi:acetyltransferase-like isoleucine patch superfamily enzyme
MIKSLFQKLLNKAGKNYTIDPLIPSSLLVTNLWHRLTMMCRGYFCLYKKVFLGKGCQISNKRNIVFGKNITIENNVSIDGYAKNKLFFGNNVKIGAYSWISCTIWKRNFYWEPFCIWKIY